MHLIIQTVSKATVFALGLGAVAGAFEAPCRTLAFAPADVSSSWCSSRQADVLHAVLGGDSPWAPLLTVESSPRDSISLSFSAEPSFSPRPLT